MIKITMTDGHFWTMEAPIMDVLESVEKALKADRMVIINEGDKVSAIINPRRVLHITPVQ